MQDIFHIKPEDARRLMSMVFDNVREPLRKLLPGADIKDNSMLTFDNATGEVIQSYPPYPEEDEHRRNFLEHYNRGCRRTQTKKSGWGTITGEPFQDMDFHGAWCIPVKLDSGETYSYFIADLWIDHGH